MGWSSWAWRTGCGTSAAPDSGCPTRRRRCVQGTALGPLWSASVFRKRHMRLIIAPGLTQVTRLLRAFAEAYFSDQQAAAADGGARDNAGGGGRAFVFQAAETVFQLAYAMVWALRIRATGHCYQPLTVLRVCALDQVFLNHDAVNGRKHAGAHGRGHTTPSAEVRARCPRPYAWCLVFTPLNHTGAGGFHRGLQKRGPPCRPGRGGPAESVGPTDTRGVPRRAVRRRHSSLSAGTDIDCTSPPALANGVSTGQQSGRQQTDS